jgi:hypothetical protein
VRGGGPVQPDQRGVADGFSDVVVDSGHGGKAG